MIKLTMVLINLGLVKLITQMMINIVILFASPVLPEPVKESLESLPLTVSSINNQQSTYYETISLSPWKRQQLRLLQVSPSMAKTNNQINNKRPSTITESTYESNHVFKVQQSTTTTNEQSADDEDKSTEIPITEASGEMLPSSPGNHHHGNFLINQSTVFLGGSCNPTTWRKDIAIPMLKALNITYYDPQKDHWEPELIELEDKAKKNAEVLFFVIDNQTRSIASMIEVSFIAATTKKLVLVIDLFPSLEPIINGEPISQYEHDILKGGRKLLMKLVERKGMPVFNQIPAALNYIPKMLKRNQLKPTTTINETFDDNNGNRSDTGDKTVQNVHDDPTLSAHHILTSLLSPYELTKLKEVYDSCTDMYNGRLSILDTKLAFLMLTGNDLDDNLIHSLIDNDTNASSNPRSINNNQTNTSDHIAKENYSSNQLNTINNNLNHQHLHNHIHQVNHSVHNHQQQSTTLNMVTSNHSYHHHHHHHHHQQHLNDTNNHHTINNHHLNNNHLDSSSTITINFKQFCSLILNYLQSNNLTSKSIPITSEGGGSHFVNHPPPPISPTVNLLDSLVNLPQLNNQSDNCDEIDSQLQPTINDNQFKDSLNNNLMDSQRIKVDIYLGGSDNPKGWRSSIAIPLIDQSNLTYSMPNINSTINGWNSMGNDLTKLESCRVLLFVIGGQRPELDTMILATHYFGQKFKVVLCVQAIPLESSSQDNQISMAAIDDYNRGRAYLSEMARKENIDVFEHLEDAIKCAIKSAKLSTN